MSADKNFCMSSYLAFRYIEDDDKEFYDGMKHQRVKLIPEEEKIYVNTSSDIDNELGKQISKFENKKKGIMLSGGMDSAILASYLSDCDAYTFRFLNGTFQKDELLRAEYYAQKYNLRLHYVDISFDIVEQYIDLLMEKKGAPIHSIEPQIYCAAKQAMEDGIELMIIGDASDYIFGGMDQLLSKDWTYDEFVRRYTYVNPEDVLINPISMQYLFDRYKIGENSIDYLGFLDKISVEESYGSYSNAFSAAGMDYYDPYERFALSSPLDLNRIRKGESKYLIRELFAKKYPDINIPGKNPMPRPVDQYFKDWRGPQRKEFKKDLDINNFTGNQKWLLWCLERFLNNHE